LTAIDGKSSVSDYVVTTSILRGFTFSCFGLVTVTTPSPVAALMVLPFAVFHRDVYAINIRSSRSVVSKKSVPDSCMSTAGN